MGKRHRRIRAHSATGQVAGAATEFLGLLSPSSTNGLPSLRSPEGPSSQSPEPNPATGHDRPSRNQFHAPNFGWVGTLGSRPPDGFRRRILDRGRYTTARQDSMKETGSRRPLQLPYPAAVDVRSRLNKPLHREAATRRGRGGFKLAPSGRAGVRALRGLFGWPGRREAPMMRHRPDLWRRWDGGGRHDRPFRRDEVSPCEIKAAIEQASRAKRADSATFRIERDTPQNVSFGGLEPVERERAQYLPQDDRAGHDRRCARRIQPAYLAPFGEGQRRQPVAQLLQPLARDRVALDPVAVVVGQPQIDRRELRRRCRRRPRLRSASGARRRARRPRWRYARPRPAPRARSAGGGSECRWRSVWRTTPTCVETWKTARRRPRRRARSSRRRCRSPATVLVAGRAAVAPSEVSRASSSPDSVAASSP